MKIGGLTLFGKMHSNGKPIKSVVVMGWHPKWSLTWSFSITWSPNYIKHGSPFYFIRYGGYKEQGLFFKCGLKLPFIGHISFANQPTMKIRK